MFWDSSLSLSLSLSLSPWSYILLLCVSDMWVATLATILCLTSWAQYLVCMTKEMLRFANLVFLSFQFNFLIKSFQFNFYATWGLRNMFVFQVFCYALSPNDGTEWRQRIQSEAEHFIDVSSMSSDMIARLINEDKIQILVNLNGYTKVSPFDIW